MQLKIPDEVAVVFTGKGIAYILDLLATQPYKDVNGLINDLIGQLSKQEEGNGPESS